MAKVSRYGKTKEESNSPPVRQEKAASEPSLNDGSDRRARSIGGSSGDNSVGTSGEDWERKLTILFASLGGGILNRLKQQAIEQLDNANACIEWYEREKERAEQALKELDELQSQLQPTTESTEASTEND